MILKILKEETSALHDQVEEAMNSQRIMESNFSRDEYVVLLQKLRAAHMALEPAVLEFDNIRNHPELNARQRLSKLEALNTDLAQLNAEPNPQQVKLAQLDNIYEAWGALYVLEGSSLGGAMILKQLKTNDKLPADGFSFYGYYNTDTGKIWSDFKNAIRAAVDVKDEDAKESTLEGARKAYQTFLTSAMAYS